VLPTMAGWTNKIDTAICVLLCVATVGWLTALVGVITSQREYRAQDDDSSRVFEVSSLPGHLMHVSQVYVRTPSAMCASEYEGITVLRNTTCLKSWMNQSLFWVELLLRLFLAWALALAPCTTPVPAPEQERLGNSRSLAHNLHDKYNYR
jgi:hypothetical protein